jgi:hypothetical protein
MSSVTKGIGWPNENFPLLHLRRGRSATQAVATGAVLLQRMATRIGGHAWLSGRNRAEGTTISIRPVVTS